MKQRDIVADDQGNHYLVLVITGDTAALESVVTKELFTGPVAELTVVPGVVAR